MSKENLFDNEEEILEDFTYDLTPYNFNMDVEGLVRRFTDKDILIPSFQRNYVWTKDGASMFIDSILRGLPSPSFFFYEESPQKYLVIDGQQRLLTIFYFMKGVFPSVKQHQDLDNDSLTRDSDNIIGEPFILSGPKIFSGWKGKSFEQLSEEQKKRIRNTYLYIVNLKQTTPDNDNSSMYLVYERINTGSTRLNPQQIRLCISHGKYSEFLCKRSVDSTWKIVFGIDDRSGTISELILRFISLYFTQGKYIGSMKAFLDREIKENDNFEKYSENTLQTLYTKTFNILSQCFDAHAFTPKKSINGYLLLITWISIANITKDIEDEQEWIKTNKIKLQKVFEQSLTKSSIKDFINDTRRASDTDTLQTVISDMTSIFKTKIN